MRLYTPRLTIRPTTSDDLEIIFDIFRDEHARKFLFDGEVLSWEDVERLLATSVKCFQEKQYGLWLLVHKNSNMVIGFAGLWNFFNEIQPQLLYGLLPSYTKQGFATEASIEIIRYTFQTLGFDSLTASCDLPNIASHEAALRVGMKRIDKKIVQGKTLTFYRIEKSELMSAQYPTVK